MTRELRVKVGLVTAAVAALVAVPVLWLLAAPLAIVAGLLGFFLAGQLLHDDPVRACAAGAALPLIALAIFAFGLIVPPWSSFSDPREPWWSTIAAFVVYGGYAVFFVGWIIVPLGLLGTVLIRRRWLETDG